ncbi:MAG: hypothetical protein RR512_08395 [Coprobacillus sp.]
MKLILDDVLFKIDSKTRDTAFFITKDAAGIKYSFDCSFEENEFWEDQISPSICINSIKTEVKNIEDLVGQCFEINDIREADKREDTFYVYEHEPLENYKLKVLEIKDDKAHIVCSGTAIIDGYAEPYTSTKFELDCWLPIIENANDWSKFGL